MSNWQEETIGDCRLICADCRDVLPTLGKVDAVVTDPPYGVRLGENGPTAIGKTAYVSFCDTPENVTEICVPVVSECISRIGRVVLTPGIRNAFKYPEPDEIGAIYNPAGAGFSRWGFTTSQPILYYGKDPRSNEKTPQSIMSCETVEKNGHPCPKPINLMIWLVNKASITRETVLDPFMGSGTTGVACVKLGRSFIGIEIEPRYFDIACRRIEQAYRQGDLFRAPPKKPVQERLGL